ncbi:MAG: methyltransferase MtfD, partial [Bryobacterales bacterium]|nr:methyltransferase MtfD [Bryobacterales bacterium]
MNAGFVSSAIMKYLDWNRIGKQFFLVDTFAGPVMSQYSAEEIAVRRAELAEETIGKGGYVTDSDRVRANFAEGQVTLSDDVASQVRPVSSTPEAGVNAPCCATSLKWDENRVREAKELIAGFNQPLLPARTLNAIREDDDSDDRILERAEARSLIPSSVAMAICSGFGATATGGVRSRAGSYRHGCGSVYRSCS